MLGKRLRKLRAHLTILPADGLWHGIGRGLLVDCHGNGRTLIVDCHGNGRTLIVVCYVDEELDSLFAM